jgi:hypothetical protein
MVASPFAKTKSVGFASLECRPYGTRPVVHQLNSMGCVSGQVEKSVMRHMVFVIGGLERLARPAVGTS